MTSLQVVPYTPQHAAAWNAFVAKAKNGHFMFDRAYMDYHSDRFSDYSLLMYRDDELVSLLPANRREDCVYSHQGLTFGGLLTEEGSVSTSLVLSIFDAMLAHLRANGVRKLVYKPIPHIYHARPAEEDIYALFRSGALLTRIDATTTIDLAARGRVSQRRLRGAKKSAKSGVVVDLSEDWTGFWQILTRRLQERHGTDPVHTIDEILLLKNRFPERIRLICATLDKEVLAGIVLYATDLVAHAQYISASPNGLDMGALDALFQWTIALQTAPTRYFDFGISTEQQGRVLNEGLIAQKEGFGGSAVACAVYEVDL